MRLPLYIKPGLTPEEAAARYPGFRIILNTAAPVIGALSLTGCVCCAGRNELRDSLNSLYLDWAHDRELLKGAVLLPDAGADIGDLCDFLEDDLMLRARYEVRE